MEGTDGGQALVDVKAAVDRIAFRFPQEAEEPVVRLVQNRTKTLTLVIHGEKREAALRSWPRSPGTSCSRIRTSRWWRWPAPATGSRHRDPRRRCAAWA
ncbi:MAG: hypothetical protein R3F43_06660 [bacterium]